MNRLHVIPKARHTFRNKKNDMVVIALLCITIISLPFFSVGEEKKKRK